jgi:hypothetical protein
MLRISGAVSLLPMYALIAWTGKNLPLCINLDELIFTRGIFLFTN